MRRFVVACFVVLFAVAGWTRAGVAAEDVFSGEQKQAIEKLVRDYLINNPEVMNQAITAWQKYQETRRGTVQRERLAKMRQAVLANKSEIFRAKYDFETGNLDGDVTMVEFFDYNCGFCKRSLPDVLTLLKTDKNLRLVLKEFPILGPDSVFAARAALAAKKQNKYWAFHVALMSTRRVNEAAVLRIAKQVGLDVEKLQADMEAPEVDQTIAANIALAEKMGINGTPAFIIADRPIPGALGLAALRTEIAGVRKEGGCKIC